MNLSVISDQIVIDKVETKNSKNFVHFLSRPDESLRIPRNWDSLLYMSKTIARAMLLKQSPIPMCFIRILESNKPVSIMLPDGTSCMVTMFENSGLAESVAFHFKGDKGTALYSGSFIRCRALLLNTLLQKYVLQGIDFLYIDNTSANSTDPVSVYTATAEILKIAKKYPDHRIIMNVPPFGYEDLIYSVVKLAKLKVFAEGLHLLVFEKYKMSELFEPNIQEANVLVVKQEVITAETISRRFAEEKLLTLRIIPCGSAPQNFFEKMGLFQVHWSPHPQLFEIYSLVNYIKPKSVNGVYSSPNLPALLRGSHQNEMENNVKIKNSPIEMESTINESIPEDLQMDKSWSVFNLVSDLEGSARSNKHKQYPGVDRELTPKEETFSQDETIPWVSRRKRWQNSDKKYASLPRRTRKKDKENLDEATTENPEQSFNNKTARSLSLSTFTSLSFCTNNDPSLDVRKGANLQLEKTIQSAKSMSVSTFTSLSSLGDKKITQDKVLNVNTQADRGEHIPFKAFGRSKTKSPEVRKEKSLITRSTQNEQAKTKPARRMTTTSKNSRESGSKVEKEIEQEDATSVSVFSSLTVSTFSSLELDSSSPSSIVQIRRKKSSRIISDDDARHGEKSFVVGCKRKAKRGLRIISKTKTTSKVTTPNVDVDRLPARKHTTSVQNDGVKLQVEVKNLGQSAEQLQQENSIPTSKIKSRSKVKGILKNQQNICNAVESNTKSKSTTLSAFQKNQTTKNDSSTKLVFTKHHKVVNNKQAKGSS